MEDKFEPNLQGHDNNGGGRGGKTRIGSETPGDSGGSKRVRIDGELTVKELGEMHISEAAIIKNLFEHRVPRTLNQIVEVELARSIAVGMGYELI